MRKIYVDMSCDKVSGQQNMQRALLNRVKLRGLYAEKEDADILVYVQVKPDNRIVEEWKKYKKEGKIIVFIHHYMSKSFYERCAVFKIADLFELIDYHIIISKESELYQYLLERNVPKDKIFVYEQAASEYTDISNRYFATEKSIDICFVGKIIKGLDRFIDYVESHNFKNVYILCPDIYEYHYQRDVSKYNVFADKTYDEVYEIMSMCKYLYCPSVYDTPPFHFETSVQEAIACGCLPVVDSSYKKIFNTTHFDKYGFVDENLIDEITETIRKEYQQRALDFQSTCYLTLTQTVDKTIRLLLNQNVIK